MAGLKETLAACEVLTRATPASLAALTTIAGLKRLEKREHLFLDKEEVESLYFSAQGQLSLYKLGGQGEKRVVFVCGPGWMLNEVTGGFTSINCEALTDAQVLCFPKAAFLRVMSEDFSLTQAVMDSMAVKIRRMYRQLKNSAGSLRGDKKIAAKLWKLARDHGTPDPQGVKINLELSITYLADMLGSQRETVSRQMKILTEAGLVINRPDGLVIPDRDRLMDFFKYA